MAEISRSALFGKLNELGYKAIESATVFCKMRGNPYVELVHWFHQVLQMQGSDLHSIVKHYQLDPAKIAKDMTTALDRLPRGASSISDLSSHLEDAVERAWVYASLLFKDSQVRTGHVVVGMLKTKELQNALYDISGEFRQLSADKLTDEFEQVLGDSPEAAMRPNDGYQVGGGADPGEASDAMAPAQLGKQEALQQFTVDLTERARLGEIDPIVGRDEEIRQIVDILMRRRQNNPMITGDAGVGKTAVVEGFAQRIARGDVPPVLKDVSLRTLDIGRLQAGASMKGEFENRLKQIIDEVQASEKPIILFIDEAHTLMGAGGSKGTGDAANLLKPALARGTLRTIGATTSSEYKQHISSDPALDRRFQEIEIDEPSVEKGILMMRGMASTMEMHHRVQVLDAALEAAVKLSHRYIPERKLPDKAVTLLDTACARVAISQHAVPAEVDDSRKRIQALETELEIISREQVVGLDVAEREAIATERLEAERNTLQELESRWKSERELVQQILDLRKQLRAGTQKVEGTGSELEAAADAEAGGSVGEGERSDLLGKLTGLTSELVGIQGEDPLILPSVDDQAIASVVADWTGIPVGRMVKNEIEAVLSLASRLGERVIGQDHALEMIAKRIQTARAGLDNPNKPIGVFMLAGPSGVGKTETALALSETLYGGENNVVTINMSEYQDSSSVSNLKGSAKGLVGYGEGGVLTEAVRRKPYSVVLLDEVEKAHSDVHEMFFQVFDKGVLDDTTGRTVDFKNTIILLTSNVGSDEIMSMCNDPDIKPDPDAIAQDLRKPLLEKFPAALLGRLVVIPYYPLDDEMIGNIARLQLGRIKTRIEGHHKIPFSFDEEVVQQIVSRCNESESGGRVIDAILTNTLLPTISREFLTRMMDGQVIERAHVTITDGEFAYEF